MLKKISIFTFISLSISFLFYNFSFSEEWKCSDYKDKVLTAEQYDKILAICDAEIKQERNALNSKIRKTKGVASELANIDYKIKISENFIYKKNLELRRLKRNINDNKSDLEVLNKNLEKLKKGLKKLIYKKLQYQNYTKIEVIFSSKSFSNFFEKVQLLDLINKKIFDKIKEFKETKKEIENLVGDLEERKMLESQLIAEKINEQNILEKNKRYKKNLLGILKKEVGTKKATIQSKEKIREAILRKKYTLASGAKIAFGDAYNLIRPYSRKLGLDPAFILAILFQESGHKGRIGGNIGRCTYNQRNTHGSAKRGYTVMSNSQKKNFLKIMSDLGLKASTQKVSCPIPRDGAYGGAMGPAQFMPNTWMMVRKKVASILGKPEKYVSPFKNQDAFVASGVLLRNNYYSKSCSNYAKKYKHISSERTLRERCAASMYYAGGNWYRYRMSYGQSVVNRANKFRRDIRIINNN